MAAPMSYTESTLAEFMLECLKDVATALGWTGLSDVQEAVNETLLAYGVSDIASATEIRKLRGLARREVWRQVRSATAGDYDFSADGGSYHRSQIHAQAKLEFALAESAASIYDAESAQAVVIQAVEYANDPYGIPDLSEYAT